MGELESTITDDDLKNAFMHFYKSVNSAKVIADQNTKISKGYGFVKFHDKIEWQRSLTEMNGKKLFTRNIRVNQANWKKNGFPIFDC